MGQRPTPEQLHAMLHLDRETGSLTWKAGALRGAVEGDIAGYAHPRGYLQMWIPGHKTEMAHRVVWALVHGAWPSAEIDHRDLNKRNNRPDNLRDCSRRVNQQNQYDPLPSNRTGYRGVSPTPDGRFKARIRDESGVRVDLGTFNTPGAAHLRYLNAKRAMHAGCTR
jgi:hypothetical protein